MSKEIREVALDAELTLSDGTPVRLALPAPAHTKSSRRWPWLILAAVVGYGVWFSQQPWLFIDGPRVVAGNTQGLDAVLCERLIDDLQPGLESTQAWLPPLDDIRVTSRCLNSRPQIETLTAQGLLFLGIPVPRLALDAIRTETGWALQANRQQLLDQQTIQAVEPLNLVEPLRALTLNVLDPVIAAQRLILQRQPEQALLALSERDGAVADLTRARAMRLLRREAEAWAIYEKHSQGDLAGFAQLALAELALARGESELAKRLLTSAEDGPIALRVDLAMQLGMYDWAATWLPDMNPDLAAPYQARLLFAQGLFRQAAEQFSALPKTQLTDPDRIQWASALEQLGQYDRAAQLLAQLPPEQAPQALARLAFHQGELEDAFTAMEALPNADDRADLVRWLIWDNQLNRAEVHLNLMTPGDESWGLRAQWNTVRGQLIDAQQSAQRIQNTALRAWHLGLIAIENADAVALKTQFEALAASDPDRANYLGAALNYQSGHTDAAKQSLASIQSPDGLGLSAVRLAVELDQMTPGRLSPGEGALFRIAQSRIRHALSQGNYPTAGNLAQSYLQARDNDPRMAPWLGLTYQAQNYVDAALDAFAQAAAGETLTLDLAQQASALAERHGEWKRVVQFLAPHASALSGTGLNRLLHGWVELGDYDIAESWIRTAVVQSPSEITLYVRWGELLEGVGDLTGAVSKYRQATQLDPSAPEPKLYLARALNLRGEIDRAVALANQAIQSTLNSEWAMIAAEIYESSGLNARAAQVLEKLPEHQHTETSKLWLARLQVAEGMNHLASETFASVMNDQVTDANLWRTWGDALAALGQTNEALDKYKKAVRLTRQTQ